jgi:hypothetical protein
MLPDLLCYIPIILIFHIYIITVKKEKKYYISTLSEINITSRPMGKRVERLTMAKNMNKVINNISKAAKRNHGATIAVVAGATLSVIGNLTIGGMTVIKAVKNKKAAAKAADPEPAAPQLPAAPAADNSNPENNSTEGNK